MRTAIRLQIVVERGVGRIVKLQKAPYRDKFITYCKRGWSGANASLRG